MHKRGVVTIVFDDGYKAVYEKVLPWLRRLEVPAVFAVPIEGEKLEKTEERAVTPWTEWLKIKAEGFEVASHTVSHHNLTLLDEKQLEEELSISQKMLEAATVVYPGGAVDDRVAQAASQYYQAGRTVHHGFEELPPAEPMRLKSYNYSRNNFSVPKANLLAGYAWSRNKWLIETYHLVDDDENKMVHSVKLSEFVRHIKFLRRLPVELKTIGQVISK